MGGILNENSFVVLIMSLRGGQGDSRRKKRNKVEPPTK